MRRALFAVITLVFLGCPQEPEDLSSTADGAAESGQDVPDQAPDLGPASDADTPECSVDSECGLPTDCLNAVVCNDGVCELDVAQKGAACADGCNLGVCDGDGQCVDQTPKECPEQDGNTCTVPTCVITPADTAGDVGASCVETVIPNGEPPYATSECWNGAVCVDGQVDTADASPTELAAECAAMETDPFGCVADFVCVGGDEKCRPVVKPDGLQCWGAEGSGGDVSCVGSSCVEGVCQPDKAFDSTCGADDLPAACDDGCAACTALVCHWIDDPGAVGAATKKVRYCQPTAQVGDACGADPCKVDQQCIFGQQTDGALGKETLGACGAGVDKTKAQCLEEAGKPALPCLLAGTSCNTAAGGCQFEQNVSNQWCWPPEGQCWKKDDTFCTHLNTGDGWDSATGCDVAFVKLDCEDNNPCTIGVCKPELSDFVCDFTKLSGPLCDDGDACTGGEACAAGLCAGGVVKCLDDEPCNGVESCDDAGNCGPGVPVNCDDQNECTDDVCNDQGGCDHTFNLAECDDDDLCTTAGVCAGGVCTQIKPKCNDSNNCNGVETCDAGSCYAGTAPNCDDGSECTDDSCDVALGGCKNTDNSKPCDDNDPCTLESMCIGGDCTLTQVNACNDGNPCTEDLCDSNTLDGCLNPAVQSGLECPGGICIKGDCVCTPSCDLTVCNVGDGCGGTCGCEAGVDCVAGICGGEEPGDLSGKWHITANPSFQSLLGVGNAYFVAMTLDFVFEENSAAASGNVGAPIFFLSYTGFSEGQNFTLYGGYTEPGEFLSIEHDETWTCTFESDTQFTGTVVDTITSSGIELDTLVWNITGVKQ